MKKLALSIIMFMFSLACYSQLTLLKEIEGDHIFSPIGGWTTFIESTDWYIPNGNKVTIYDDDLNVIKVINIPTGLTGVSYLYKNIFTHSDKYEYTASKKVGDASYYYIYNEDGKMIYDLGEFSPYMFKNNKFITYKTTNVDGKLKWTTRIYKIAGAVGVSENSYGQLQQPYPNPTSELINVPYSIDSTKGLEIYNAGGSLIDIIPLNPQNTIVQVVTSNYKRGTYFWRIGDNNGTFIVR